MDELASFHKEFISLGTRNRSIYKDFNQRKKLCLVGRPLPTARTTCGFLVAWFHILASYGVTNEDLNSRATYMSYFNSVVADLLQSFIHDDIRLQKSMLKRKRS